MPPLLLMDALLLLTLLITVGCVMVLLRKLSKKKQIIDSLEKVLAAMHVIARAGRAELAELSLALTLLSQSQESTEESTVEQAIRVLKEQQELIILLDRVITKRGRSKR